MARKRYYQDELLYNVSYTIDSHGLRSSPPFQSGENVECILFFGGSFTFGQGVDDAEAMPYVVGMKSDDRYRIYNFGVPAYGPHQMLWTLENWIVEEAILGCQPRYAIYQYIQDHVRRSAGLKSPPFGPRYALKANGEPVLKGTLHDRGVFYQLILSQPHKSLAYERVFGSQRLIRKSDTQLFLAVVDASRRTLSLKYPEIDFHVVLWGGKGVVWEELRSRGTQVHAVREILPDYQNRGRWRISPHDSHPSALAHEFIANYLVSHVVKGEPIVNTPFDALKTFAHGRIDTLVTGDFIVDKP